MQQLMVAIHLACTLPQLVIPAALGPARAITRPSHHKWPLLFAPISMPMPRHYKAIYNDLSLLGVLLHCSAWLAHATS